MSDTTTTNEPDIKINIIDADVSKEDIESCKIAVYGVLGRLSPDGWAYLRAYLCSELIPDAPSAPEVLQQLAAFVMTDAGDETVKALLGACTKAYVSTSST